LQVYPTQYQLANIAVKRPNSNKETTKIILSTQGFLPHRASRMKAGNSTHIYRRWLINSPELNGRSAPRMTKMLSLQRY
jgi:hypothetical protein